MDTTVIKNEHNTHSPKLVCEYTQQVDQGKGLRDQHLQRRKKHGMACHMLQPILLLLMMILSVVSIQGRNGTLWGFMQSSSLFRTAHLFIIKRFLVV